MLQQLLEEGDYDYIGETSCHESSALPVEACFDPSMVEAAYLSPERSIDTHFIADLLSESIIHHPRIHFYPGVEVQGLKRDKQGYYSLICKREKKFGKYKTLVNATWNSRLALDASLGFRPSEPWLYRYKLAVHLQGHPHIAGLPSCTFLLGPFGDLVNFNNGAYYLSWYSLCRIGTSSLLLPPEYTLLMTADNNVKLAIATQQALSGLLPALDGIEIDFEKAQVKGGHIFAWGDSDITKLDSQLHQRYRVGVFSNERYHSIDTGKYGMAPMHARELVRRICS